MQLYENLGLKLTRSTNKRTEFKKRSFRRKFHWFQREETKFSFFFIYLLRKKWGWFVFFCLWRIPISFLTKRVMLEICHTGESWVWCNLPIFDGIIEKIKERNIYHFSQRKISIKTNQRRFLVHNVARKSQYTNNSILFRTNNFDVTLWTISGDRIAWFTPGNTIHSRRKPFSFAFVNYGKKQKYLGDFYFYEFFDTLLKDF